MDYYIYLDNAAAMRTDADLVKRFSRYALEYFPNPEAEHAAARNCRKELTAAAERLSMALTTTDEYKIFWTTSATEAMNITFSFPEFCSGTVLTSNSEHPAFAKPLNCKIRKINIKRDGTFDLDDLEMKLDKTVTAVALHHVQNETGAVQDLCEVRRIIRQRSPEALLIADTVQSVGKLAIPWSEAEINIAFIAGHKLGIPTGGALIYRFSKKAMTTAFSQHLANLRSVSHAIGRVDPAVALTLADAVELAEKNKQVKYETVKHLNSVLRARLVEREISAEFLLAPEIASPYITSLLLPPYQGQVLVRMLSEKGVMVSEGSACEAASKEVSAALLAMGISKQNARSVIRISFGFQSDESDVNELVSTLADVLKNY